jgi:hypothetical protein
MNVVGEESSKIRISFFDWIPACVGMMERGGGDDGMFFAKLKGWYNCWYGF